MLSKSSLVWFCVLPEENNDEIKLLGILKRLMISGLSYYVPWIYIHEAEKGWCINDKIKVILHIL